MTDDVTAGPETAPENTAVQNSGDSAPPVQAENTENAANSEQTDAGNAGAEKPEGEQPKPKSKGGGFQKRISELTREREEKAREAEFWREQALKGAKPEQAKPQADPDAPPKMGDFKTYEDYVEARAEWKYIQTARQAEAKKAAEESTAKFNEVQEQFRTKLDKAGETYADFDDALENINGLQAHPMVAAALMQSDKGVDILYYLGTHPEEAKRIHGLNPLAQVKELGRIEATLSQPAARKITQANPPPTTLRGGGTAKKDLGEMSMDEYVAARMANPNA